MTDAIKNLEVLIVQLESVPVLLRHSRSKEALWTRAVNFTLPRQGSSRPEIPVYIQLSSAMHFRLMSVLRRSVSNSKLLMCRKVAANHPSTSLCKHPGNLFPIRMCTRINGVSILIFALTVACQVS